MKRQPLTGREHLAMGARLSRLLEEAQEIAPILGTAYSKPTWRQAVAIEREVQKLKHALDSAVCSEHPMSVQRVEGVPITNIYYGWKRGHRGTARYVSGEDARANLRAAVASELADNPWAEEP